MQLILHCRTVPRLSLDSCRQTPAPQPASSLGPHILHNRRAKVCFQLASVLAKIDAGLEQWRTRVLAILSPLSFACITPRRRRNIECVENDLRRAFAIISRSLGDSPDKRRQVSCDSRESGGFMASNIVEAEAESSEIFGIL